MITATLDELRAYFYDKGLTFDREEITQLFQNSASGYAGDATASLDPGAPMASKFYTVSPGVTLTHFLDSGGLPLAIPTTDAGMTVVGAFVYYTGAYWAPRYFKVATPTNGTALITDWAAGNYSYPATVRYQGKVWNTIAGGATASDTPGTSSKWVSALSYYDAIVATTQQSETLGYDLTGTLNNASGSGSVNVNYGQIVTIGGSTLNSLKLSAIATGTIVLVQFRKMSANFWQDVSRTTLNVVAGKQTLDMTSYGITCQANDFFGLLPGTTNGKYATGQSRGYTPANLNATSGKYELTSSTFPVEPGTPNGTVFDYQYTCVLASVALNTRVAANETSLGVQAASIAANAASIAANGSAITALQTATQIPAVSETIGYQNTGTLSNVGGDLTQLQLSDIIVTVAGYLQTLKISASATGQLTLVQLRRSGNTWTELGRNTLNVAAGNQTLDVSGLNIATLAGDTFGILAVGSVVVKYKSGQGTGVSYRPIAVGGDGKFTFTSTNFPNTTSGSGIALDYQLFISTRPPSAVQKFASLDTDIAGIKAGPAAETVIKVAKEGTVGVDGVQFVGNGAIQAAINSISDASALKPYVIDIAPGVYEATAAADYTANGSVVGYMAWVLPKPYITLRGADRDTTIIRASLPNNLGGSFVYSNYNTMVFNSDNIFLENLTIQATNIRYATHIDNGPLGNQNNKHRGKNCVWEHFGNTADAATAWPTWYAIGLGTSDGHQLTFDDCVFKSPLSPLHMHSNRVFKKGSQLTYNRCVFINTATSGQYLNKLGDIFSFSSHQNDLITLNNCQFINCWKIAAGGSGNLALSLAELSFRSIDLKVKGSGNDPFVFNNNAGGGGLRIISKSTGTGSSVRVDPTSTAFAKLFKDKDNIADKYTRDNKEVSEFGYSYRDGDTGISGYACGHLDISNSTMNGAQYLSSMGKRLGDCSTVNLTLTVTVDGGTPINIVFNKNYAGAGLSNPAVQADYTNAQILAEINAALTISGTPVAVASEYAYDRDYFPEFTDVVKKVRTAGSVTVLKGMAVAFDAGYIRPATNADTKLFGIALDDIISGAYGRVLTRGYIDTLNTVSHFALQDTYVAIVKGDTLGLSTTAGKISKTSTGTKFFTCVADGYLSFNV